MPPQQSATVSSILYYTVSVTFNFNPLTPKSEAFVPVARSINAVSFGGNLSNPFQAIVLTTFGANARTRTRQHNTWGGGIIKYLKKSVKYLISIQMLGSDQN